jgi:hypothetical protein
MQGLNSTYLPYSYNSNPKQSLLLLIFFLIWPFGAFLYALYYFDRQESKIVLILFTALLGYSMIAVSSSLDLYRVQESFPEYAHLSYRAFSQRNKIIFSNSSDNGSVDIYRDTITFIVSRFTADSKWLMFVFGLVAGYVYTRVLSLFIVDGPVRKSFMYLLILSFSFIIGIDQLSGVRFSLAAYVFFYGSIKVLIYGDKRYLFIAALSILIHFSFLPVVLLLFVFLKLKNYPKIIYLLLILSFILPNLLHSYIIQYSGFFGQAIEARAELYNNLTSELNYGSDTSWYVKYRINLMLIFSYLLLIITRIKKKDLNFSDKINDLFLFSLIVLSFVNFTLDIPHFGYRFQFMFLMFAFFYLFKVYAANPNSPVISRLVITSLPFSCLMIVYSLRSTLYLTPLSLYYFNLPGLFLYHPTSTTWLDLFN